MDPDGAAEWWVVCRRRAIHRSRLQLRVARGSPGVLGSAEELTSVAHRPPPRQEQFLVCLGNNSSSQPQPTATATADHGRIDSEESFLLSADIVGDSFFFTRCSHLYQLELSKMKSRTLTETARKVDAESTLWTQRLCNVMGGH